MELRVVDDAHRAHVDETADPGLLHCGNDRPGAFGVDQAQVGAAVEVTRDRDEMDDGIDAGHRRGEGLRPRHVPDPDLDVGPAGGRQRTEDHLPGGRGPDHGDHPMTRGQQAGDEMSADEAACAGDEDRGHGCWPFGFGGAAERSGWTVTAPES